MLTEKSFNYPPSCLIIRQYKELIMLPLKIIANLTTIAYQITVVCFAADKVCAASLRGALLQLCFWYILIGYAYNVLVINSSKLVYTICSIRRYWQNILFALRYWVYIRHHICFPSHIYRNVRKSTLTLKLTSKHTSFQICCLSHLDPLSVRRNMKRTIWRLDSANKTLAKSDTGWDGYH